MGHFDTQFRTYSTASREQKHQITSTRLGP